MDLISSLRYAAKQKQQEASTPQLHPDLVGAFSLRGRVAVVTGAGKGIGEEAAIVFAQAGAHVVVADVDEDGANATASRARGLGVEATVVPTDVSRRADVDALAQRATELHGRIDVWANVAGIIRDKAVVDVSEDDFNAVLAVNLAGTFWACATAARIMASAGRGSIINVSSTAGEGPAPGVGVYGMSKAAIVSLTRTLAAEVGRQGVRVNAVAPGFIDTPMNMRHVLDADGAIDEHRHQELLEARAKLSPLGLTGEPSDIAYCMLYLAADASRFVTGQVLRPNGGISML